MHLALRPVSVINPVKMEQGGGRPLNLASHSVHRAEKKYLAKQDSGRPGKQLQEERGYISRNPAQRLYLSSVKGIREGDAKDIHALLCRLALLGCCPIFENKIL